MNDCGKMELPIGEREVLRAAHDLMQEAMGEWIGMDRNAAMEEVNYLTGIIDLTAKLLTIIDAEDEDD